MLGARCLWENLVGGATQTQKKKQVQVEYQVQKKSESETKAKQKLKVDIRKALFEKLKHTEHERKQKLDLLQKFRAGEISYDAILGTRNADTIDEKSENSRQSSKQSQSAERPT